MKKELKIISNEELGTAPVGKLLFKLALPAIAAQVINMLYNIVDRIYIGHMPTDGTLAFTSIGVCTPLILIISAFAALVSMGGAPRAAIFMGKGENEKAEKILGNSFTLLIAISIICTIVFAIWNKDLLLLFGASENTITDASRYMTIYSLGTVFVQLSLGLNAYITTQGFAKTSMLTILIGAVCNIILDPIFIYGFKMGISGAALATIISQAASATFVICFLFSKRTILKIKIKNLLIDWQLTLPCVALGLASFIMQFTESVVMVCFNSSLQKYGGDSAVGSMSVLLIVMQFTMLPLQGLGQGAQPIISYNYGACKANRVKNIFKKLLISCLVYSATLWLIVMIFPKLVISIFSSDVSLIINTIRPLRIYMSVACIFGIQIACQMTLVSTSNAIASVLVALVRKLGLLIPFIYIFPLIFGKKATSVFMAEPIADFLAVTFTIILFIFQFKKAIKKITISQKEIITT